MKVVYQTLTLLLFFSCAAPTVRNITPKTQLDIAVFDVILTTGEPYDAFVFNFVATGEVWIFWAKDSSGEVGFNPIYRVDYGVQYYEPFSMKGGYKKESTKDLVVEMFLTKKKEIEKINQIW